jgi:methyl-accepting chemotaxis protein
MSDETQQMDENTQQRLVVAEQMAASLQPLVSTLTMLERRIANLELAVHGLYQALQPTEETDHDD